MHALQAYYGGEVRCDIEAGPVDEYNPAELVCGGCSDISRAQMCPKHGTDFLEYKCRYCCSVAVFFCFGTTHFCNACHDDFQRVANLPKQQLPRCPAGKSAAPPAMCDRLRERWRPSSPFPTSRSLVFLRKIKEKQEKERVCQAFLITHHGTRPKAKQLEGEECPLHIKHPPTGEEFALGCGVCRNTHTF
ncbi:hypothetical protein HPB48_005034 [Haemaphysalis longicornis]|uniref:Uncharacterized protein n=1 Tax=Haemaphysalis longicornis TaxID=44386 RepID=A0A9J6GEU0_HAELO|nr:hypothetical protein HPB48_005034 [Haemaphysalis longicornis]